jgi:hypothetical protein
MFTRGSGVRSKTIVLPSSTLERVSNDDSRERRKREQQMITQLDLAGMFDTSSRPSGESPWPDTREKVDDAVRSGSGLRLQLLPNCYYLISFDSDPIGPSKKP